VEKIVLPRRYLLLWKLTSLPYFVTTGLCLYLGLNLDMGFEKWLIISAGLLAMGCRVTLMHLFSLYKVRHTWSSFLLAKGAGRWVITFLFVLMFAALWFSLWLMQSDQLPPHGVGIYSLTSLTVVLNLALGSIWIVGIAESVLLFYTTYSEKYRRFWFDYFMSTGQLKPKDEEKRP